MWKYRSSLKRENELILHNNAPGNCFREETQHNNALVSQVDLSVGCCACSPTKVMNQSTGAYWYGSINRQLTRRAREAHARLILSCFEGLSIVLGFCVVTLLFLDFCGNFRQSLNPFFLIVSSILLPTKRQWDTHREFV